MSRKSDGAASGKDPKWVVSQDYEGPNRRRRAPLFSRPKVRLDDAGFGPQNASESMDTTLRRLSLWRGLSGADRDQRAKFIATIEALMQRGRNEGQRAWPDILEAVAAYLRAVGARGKVDEPLIEEALHAAHFAHAEGDLASDVSPIIARLRARTPPPR